mmetsp:Transcript_35687/g.102838  ORF Transcript_35687/g.102838 Transcript_35687/m.102838 type:complete len:215 (+) Transcript_35687:134-778(+)
MWRAAAAASETTLPVVATLRRERHNSRSRKGRVDAACHHAVPPPQTLGALARSAYEPIRRRLTTSCLPQISFSIFVGSRSEPSSSSIEIKPRPFRVDPLRILKIVSNATMSAQVPNPSMAQMDIFIARLCTCEACAENKRLGAKPTPGGLDEEAHGPRWSTIMLKTPPPSVHSLHTMLRRKRHVGRTPSRVSCQIIASQSGLLKHSVSQSFRLR